MTRQLSVWLFGAHIGTLSQIDGRLNFSYESDWLNTRNAIPLSQSLPLQAEAFDDRATRPFFAGLLPEGDKRKLIAQALPGVRDWLVENRPNYEGKQRIEGKVEYAFRLLNEAIGQVPEMNWLRRKANP